MSGTDSRDGWTDGTRCSRTHGVRHRNVVDQVAMEPLLKTEAPGCRVWVRPWGPRPGLAHPSPILPHSPICTVGRAMLGGRGQAKAEEGEEGEQTEEKEAGEAGTGSRPGRGGAVGVAGIRAQTQAGWYPEDLRGGGFGHSGDWQDSCFS